MSKPINCKCTGPEHFEGCPTSLNWSIRLEHRNDALDRIMREIDIGIGAWPEVSLVGTDEVIAEVKRQRAAFDALRARAEKAEASIGDLSEVIVGQRRAELSAEQIANFLDEMRERAEKAEAALAEALEDLVAMHRDVETQRRLKEIATENLADALIERDAARAVIDRDAAVADEALNGEMKAKAALAAEKARADKLEADCAALRAALELVGPESCRIEGGAAIDAALAAPSAGAGWVSPEEHARVVQAAANIGLIGERVMAERDAALAVKAQLLGALERVASDLRDGKAPMRDTWWWDSMSTTLDVLDAAIADAKGGAP
jgi:hypothetical protein